MNGHPPDPRFEEALAFVLAHEGGYSCDPRDPGGETKYGISRRSYPGLDIANLSREQAASIYRRDYWDALGLSRLPMELALPIFDAAVNAGREPAVRWLQEALNGALGLDQADMALGANETRVQGNHFPAGREPERGQRPLSATSRAAPALDVDGQLGPLTLACVEQAVAAGPVVLGLVRAAMLLARVRHYLEISERPTLRPFLRGWLRRAMALAGGQNASASPL